MNIMNVKCFMTIANHLNIFICFSVFKNKMFIIFNCNKLITIFTFILTNLIAFMQLIHMHLQLL